MLLCTAPAFSQFSVISRGPLAGNCNGPALGLDAVNNVVYSCGTPQPSAPSVWKATGGGTTTTVNGGATLPVVNLSNTTPPASANGINGTFQNSGNNVSVEVVGDGNVGHCLSGTGTYVNCVGSTVGVNGGAAIGTVNLNNTTPAAGTNGLNVQFQNSGNNVSAEVVGDGNPAHFLNGQGAYTTSGSATTIDLRLFPLSSYSNDFGAAANAACLSLSAVGGYLDARALATPLWANAEIFANCAKASQVLLPAGVLYLSQPWILSSSSRQSIRGVGTWSTAGIDQGTIIRPCTNNPNSKALCGGNPFSFPTFPGSLGMVTNQQPSPYTTTVTGAPAASNNLSPILFLGGVTSAANLTCPANSFGYVLSDFTIDGDFSPNSVDIYSCSAQELTNVSGLGIHGWTVAGIYGEGFSHALFNNFIIKCGFACTQSPATGSTQDVGVVNEGGLSRSGGVTTVTITNPGPMVVTSVNGSGQFTGNFPGVWQGRVVSIFGFSNSGNNVVNATVTSSSSTTLQVSNTTISETCPVTCLAVGRQNNLWWVPWVGETLNATGNVGDASLLGVAQICGPPTSGCVTPTNTNPVNPSQGTLTITSVTSAGVYHGTITGGGSNAFVGAKFTINGFTNAADNITNATVTASSTTTLSFAATGQGNDTCTGACLAVNAGTTTFTYINSGSTATNAAVAQVMFPDYCTVFSGGFPWSISNLTCEGAPPGGLMATNAMWADNASAGGVAWWHIEGLSDDAMVIGPLNPSSLTLLGINYGGTVAQRSGAAVINLGPQSYSTTAISTRTFFNGNRVIINDQRNAFQILGPNNCNTTPEACVASFYSQGIQLQPNCLLGGATGATTFACGGATTGRLAVSASQTSFVVTTSSLTPLSNVQVTQTFDNSGIPGSPNCGSTVAAPIQSSRTSTAFTVTIPSTANVTCYTFTTDN